MGRYWKKITEKQISELKALQRRKLPKDNKELYYFITDLWNYRYYYPPLRRLIIPIKVIFNKSLKNPGFDIKWTRSSKNHLRHLLQQTLANVLKYSFYNTVPPIPETFWIITNPPTNE